MDQELLNLEREASIDPSAIFQLIRFKLRGGIPLSLDEDRIYRLHLLKQMKQLRDEMDTVTEVFHRTAGTALKPVVEELFDSYPLNDIYVEYTKDEEPTPWSVMGDLIALKPGIPISLLLHISHKWELPCIGCQSTMKSDVCFAPGEPHHLIVSSGNQLTAQEMGHLNSHSGLMQLYPQAINLLENLTRSDLASAIARAGAAVRRSTVSDDRRSGIYLSRNYYQFATILGPARKKHPYEDLNYDHPGE